MPNFEKQETGKIDILNATPEDISDIIAIQKETWLSIYPNEEYGITAEDIQSVNWEDPSRVERWQNNISENKELTQIWIAKDKERVVGFCSADREAEKNRVTTIYILPEYQNKGIGQKLIQEAFDWLGADKDIVVSMAKYNKKAIEFYEKSGFQERQ